MRDKTFLAAYDAVVEAVGLEKLERLPPKMRVGMIYEEMQRLDRQRRAGQKDESGPAAPT